MRQRKMERFMNKILLFFLLILPHSVFGQTYYYKLTKKIVDNVPYTNTAGGQYITFSNQFCYESDSDGNSVGNGLMNYKETVNGSAIYKGSCYFSEYSTFKFNADKSVLNIIPPNGTVYVYRKATPPKSQTTCSLIKKAESKGSSGVGNYVGTPNYNNSTNYPMNQDGSTENPTKSEKTPQKRWHNVTKTVDCNFCHRSGKCQTCNGKGWYQGTYGPIDCPNCYGYKTGKCSHCQGNGTVQKIEQVFD